MKKMTYGNLCDIMNSCMINQSELAYIWHCSRSNVSLLINNHKLNDYLPDDKTLNLLKFLRSKSDIMRQILDEYVYSI